MLGMLKNLGLGVGIHQLFTSLVGMAKDKTSDIAMDKIKDELPGLLKLWMSAEDERRMGAIWSHLSEEERQVLTKFMDEQLEKFQETSLRYILVDIKMIPGKGEEKNEARNEYNPRAHQFITNLVKDIKRDPEQAKRQLLVTGIIPYKDWKKEALEKAPEYADKTGATVVGGVADTVLSFNNGLRKYYLGKEPKEKRKKTPEKNPGGKK